jgi:hypothetical protein
MPFFGLPSRGSGQGTFGRGNAGPKSFLNRMVITSGYVAGGYRAGVAWRNVNKLNQSTDITTNLGDLMQEAANYTKGAQTKDTAYIFSTAGTGTQGVGAFTSTSCFNMRNDTSMTKNNNMNSGSTIGDASTIYAPNLTGGYNYAYANGNIGNSTIQKFNMTTEVFTGGLGTSLPQGGTGAGSHGSENFGYWWAEGATSSADADANGRKKFVFATETESTVPANGPANHGQQKGLWSKVGYGYGGNEGGYGGGRYFRKWNYATESNVGTYQKMVWWCGEENFIMGQTAGYVLGVYSDTTGGNVSAQTQVNDSGKYVYATDVGTMGASSMWPTGTASGTGASGDCCGGGQIAGRSSAVGFWRD